MNKRHICRLGFIGMTWTYERHSSLDYLHKLHSTTNCYNSQLVLRESNQNAACCYALEVDHWKPTALDFVTYLAPITK